MNKLDILKNVREAFFKYKRNNPILTPSVSSFVAGWRAREEFEREEENKNELYEPLIITDVVVLSGSGTDKITFKFNGPSPYPDWMPEEKPFFRLEVSKGYGVEYVRNVFRIEPEIISTS
jgi:hypothetical protein